MTSYIDHYQLHSSCPPVVQCGHTAIQSQEDRQGVGGCSYIIKVKASFKQGFSLRPCPVSLPGHAVLLECGHKSLIWGLGLGKQAGKK